MKPKERFLNYTLLTTPDCDPAQTSIKQDIPIDLSTKKSVSNGHPFGLFKDYDNGPFHSPPHMNEWATKYCFPNLVTKHYAYPHNLFPYLFINPNCLNDIDAIKKREELIYDSYGLPYQLPQDGLLLPYKIDPYNQQDRQSDGDKPPPSTESSTSSSSSSSPYNHHEYHPHDYQEPKKCYNKSPLRSTPESTILHTKHKGSQVVSNRAAKIKKSFSYPSLPLALRKSMNEPNSRTATFRRAKSECNLHLIVSYSAAPAKICAPKKLFASNYYQNKMKEESRLTQCKMADQQAVINSSSSNNPNSPSLNGNADKPNGNNTNNGHTGQNGHNGLNGHSNQPANGTQTTRFYRNYRKEVLECWDNENRENVNINRETKGNSDNSALDLRMNIPLHKFHPNQPDNPKAGFDKMDNFHHHNFHNSELAGKFDPLKSQPVNAFPIDMYRQYYYYLIQEPAFASRAAVAVAEAYAKLLTHPNKPDKCNQQTLNKSPPIIEKFETNYISEPKRTSPDCIQNGSRTELRSADTTNCSIPFDRKRISRPLTGKHVRHGTGASPSTLVSLRNMIQQRQKLKESGKFDPSNRYGRGKGNKRVKRK